MIDRYPGSNQHPDGLDMRVFTRGNQSRTAVTVHAVDIRAMAERQCQNLVQSLGSGIQEGRILHGILRVHVSSGKNQRRSRSDGVVLGGLDEWSPFALAARFDVRAGSQGSGNSCGIDLGDALSPNHDWTVNLTAGEIADAFDVGELQSLKILSRNGFGTDGGRVTAVEVVGTDATVGATGMQFRQKLGLKSDWFTVGDGAGVVVAPDSESTVPESNSPSDDRSPHH